MNLVCLCFKIIKKSSNSNEKRKNFLSDLSNKFIGNNNNSNNTDSLNNSGKKSTIPNHVATPTTQSPIPVSTSPKPPAKPAKVPNETFRARVVYSYMPVNDDELAIQENQIVEVLRLVCSLEASS